MEERVKRGTISALIMNLLAPGSGLIYLHRPLGGLTCAVVLLLVLTADRIFQTFTTLEGMAGSLGAIALVWLGSMLAIVFRVGKGLPVTVAKRDLGPWIVIFLLLQCLSLSMIAAWPYASYVSTGDSVETLLPDERFLALTGDHRPDKAALGSERLRPGDVVVIRQGNTHFARRVWGLPGDVLEIREESLFRNGKPVASTPGIWLPNRESQWIVPEESIFIWSDEPRSQAEAQGCKHISAVVGKALYIYWSGDRSRIGLPVE